MPLPTTPLLTARLLLRPYQPPDAEAFFALLDRNRDRLRASFPDRTNTVLTLADAPGALTAFATDWASGRFYVLGIWLQATGAYLGDICLMPQNAGQAEIGYYLAQEAEGHGYAREALAAVVAFGFSPAVGAQRLLIRCFADNVRGQAVALAAGFRPEKPTRFPWFRNADALSHILRYVQLAP